MTLGSEMDHAVLFTRIDQFPVVAVEGGFGGQIGHAITDIADFGYSAHYENSIRGEGQIGFAIISNIACVAVALSTGGLRPIWPWQIARLDRTT